MRPAAARIKSAISRGWPLGRCDGVQYSDESNGDLLQECRRLFPDCGVLGARSSPGFTPRSGARAPSAAGEVAPELTRSPAGAYAKGSREIGLGREIQRDGDIEEGLISAHQHLLCALETVRTDVLMRGLTDGGLEGPRKVESAQARDIRELSDCKIALEVRCDVFPHPGQSASIESLVRELLEIFVGGEIGAEMLNKHSFGPGGDNQIVPRSAIVRSTTPPVDRVTKELLEEIATQVSAPDSAPWYSITPRHG